MDPSHLQQLIEHYGYIAVFIGAVLEGETVLVIAGFAAHRGYLDLGGVVAVATLGGFLGDQFFFTLGRARGRQLLARFPAIETKSARVQALVDRYHTWLIVSVRFLYGLRVAGPVLLGMSEVSHTRFAVFNLLGALIWASLIAGAGYLFGQTVEMMLSNAKRYEMEAAGVLVAAGIAFWLYRRMRLKKKTGLTP
ncbi:MAG TPA: DedA family protein [Burkholderiales bacterium]|nr:DedA family protein [Burkholderiales bacterium]